jgi:sulfatase maturation enzyme AslB (radical SAM superfamily)
VADAPASSRPAGTPFDRLAPWRACGDCAFIPVCAGGCSVASHTEQGDMHAPTCHKRSLETALVSLAHEVASAA